MKDLSGQSQETWTPGVKLGIVRLGKAAGKMKYTLLDERDISLAREHLFEARLEIDRNGNGAQIFAFAFHLNAKGVRCGARYLHELVWERHNGGIAADFAIQHRNGITMDNRLENLMLVPHSQHFNHHLLATMSSTNQLSVTAASPSASAFGAVGHSQPSTSASAFAHHNHHSQAPPHSAIPKQPIEHSLYWAAIQQLPPEHLVDEFPETSGTNKCYDANGDLVEDEDEVTCYYECHYPPCIRMEREPREFSICGRCQEARYCGPACQQRDWPVHKKYCREKVRPRPAAAQAIANVVSIKRLQPER